jgi:hypothetical protein
MNMIFRIYYTTEMGNVCAQDHTSLTEALAAAEYYRKVRCKFVTIVSESTDQVGGSGVDSVKNGKLPNGDNYTYTKYDALSQRSNVYSDVISDGGMDPR